MFQSFSKIWIVVAVAVFAVAGIFYWQYFETQKEIEISQEKIIELEKSEEQMAEQEKVTENETTDKKIYKDIATSFCEERDDILKYFSLLNFDDDAEKEIFIMCVIPEWNFWTPGSQGVFNLYVLERKDERYQTIWQRNTSNDFNLRDVKEPKIVDIDGDGIDEIILAGSNWGGTCTYYRQSNFIYSPEYKETFFSEKREGIKISEDEVFCVEKEREFNSSCNSWRITTVCFSDNLKKSEYQIFKIYLENALNFKTQEQVKIFEESNKNAAIDYFENVELQYETEAQKQEIFVALNDILNLSEEQLKQKKYKDYTGKENQWDLLTLIYRYFVPDRQEKAIGDNFYHDIKSEEAQKQIEQILEKYF